MKKIGWIFDNIENIICSTLLAITLVLLSIQVVARYVFNSSPVWTEEAARMLFIWIVFIGASYAAQKHAHIAIDNMIHVYPAALRKYIELFGVLVWIAFSAVVAFYGYRFTMTMFKAQRISLTLGINMGWIYMSIPLGYALTIVRIVQVKLIPQVKSIWNRSAVEDDVSCKLP